MKVFKSIKVKWLDENYDQSVASKLTKAVTRTNIESNDFLGFDIDNYVQNQGARDSSNMTDPNPIFSPSNDDDATDQLLRRPQTE